MRSIIRFQILYHLAKHEGGWQSTPEIAEEIKSSRQSVLNCLDMMRFDLLVRGRPKGGRIAGKEGPGITMEWEIRKKGEKRLALWLESRPE